MVRKSVGGLQNLRISQVSDEKKVLEERLEERLDRLDDLCVDTEMDLIDCIKEGLENIKNIRVCIEGIQASL